MHHGAEAPEAAMGDDLALSAVPPRPRPPPHILREKGLQADSASPRHAYACIHAASSHRYCCTKNKRVSYVLCSFAVVHTHSLLSYSQSRSVISPRDKRDLASVVQCPPAPPAPGAAIKETRHLLQAAERIEGPWPQSHARHQPKAAPSGSQPAISNPRPPTACRPFAHNCAAAQPRSCI